MDPEVVLTSTVVSAAVAGTLGLAGSWWARKHAARLAYYPDRRELYAEVMRTIEGANDLTRRSGQLSASEVRFELDWLERSWQQLVRTSALIGGRRVNRALNPIRHDMYFALKHLHLYNMARDFDETEDAARSELKQVHTCLAQIGRRHPNLEHSMRQVLGA